MSDSTKRNFLALACSAALLLSTPSCALFTPEGKTMGDGSKGEAQDDKGYLQEGGPTVGLDTSPGQKNLLEVVRETKEKVLELQRERDEVVSKLRQSQMRLEGSETEFSGEKAKRVSLESELKESLAKVRDRDARLLDAAIENAKLEQRILDLEIEAAKSKIARHNASNPDR